MYTVIAGRGFPSGDFSQVAPDVDGQLRLQVDEPFGDVLGLLAGGLVLVEPTYYMTGTINGNTFDGTTSEEELKEYKFKDGELCMTFTEESQISIRRDMGGQTIMYMGSAALGSDKTVTLSKDGSYKLTMPAGDVTFKVVQKKNDSLTLSYCIHNWDDGEITRQPNCTQPGIRTVTCNACGHKKNLEVPTNDKHTFSGGICSLCGTEEPKYYLVGTINGADYTGDEYLFVDGKLVLTFTNTTSIYLKDENGDAYYAAENVVEPPVNFVTGVGYSGRMTLPMYTEITFTLVNENGVLNLGYTMPCAHLWNSGTVIKETTCTEDGEILYACNLCGETRTEIKTASGHSYNNGICGACGDKQEDYFRTIYFFDSGNWDAPYIYTWSDSNGNLTGAWPGSLMEPVNGVEGLFRYDVPKSATGVKFHNNGSADSDDQTIPADKNMFTYTGSAWSTYGEDLQYALFGHINGSNYADWSDVGEYIFVDGTLKVTFDQDSYVAVKTTNNAYWYMAQSYIKGNEGVFYKTSTGAGEKMFVPAGAEVTFTLVVNSDDTISLSYIVACTHQWSEGVVTKDATCKEEGIRTFTCGLCGNTKTEKIAVLSHNYVDGTCTSCGQVEADGFRVIYFRNTGNWTEPYFWAWNDNGQNFSGGAWPGMPMEHVEGDLYKVVLEKEATKIIFNGDGAQTSDLILPQDGRDIYTYSTNMWSTYGVTNYYLVGNINGANYGVESDFANLGDYKFVDGKLVVTFTADSYVLVKTDDNVNWFMTDGWMGNETEGVEVVLYNSNDIETDDKLFVPAGTWAFTLTENDDGSVTVSYTEAAAPAMLLLEEQTQVSQAAVNAVVASEEEAEPVATPTGFTMNLDMLMNQLVSDKIYGAIDDGEVDDDFPGIEEEPEVKDPTVKLVGAGLAFKDEIFYNIYFNVNNPENVGIVEMGLATWTTKFDGTVENAEYVLNNVVWEGESFKVRSQPIAAKNMGEELYLKVYLKLADGSYIYSDLVSYSAELYAQTLLERDTTSDSMKDLCVALMNYGAAAQLYFGYKTDDLMNANLSAEQKAMISEYSEDMLEDVVMAGDKANGLAANGAVTSKSASVNFGGAFGINYNFVTTHTPDGVMKLYVWTKADFEKADSLTLENASQMIVMTNCGPNAYTARVSGIAAKNVEDTVYVCGIYEADGVTYSTGVLPYSVGNYCERLAAQEGKFQDLAKATCVYAYYARIHLLGA